MGDAVRDDACLAAPRAGQDQQWTFSVSDGFALLRIQALQEIHLMGVCLNSIMGTKQRSAEKFDGARAFPVANSLSCAGEQNSQFIRYHGPVDKMVW